MNAPLLHIGPTKDAVDAVGDKIRDLLLVFSDTHACEEVQLAALKTFRQTLQVRDTTISHCNFNAGSTGSRSQTEGTSFHDLAEKAIAKTRSAPTPTPPPPAHGHGSY